MREAGLAGPGFISISPASNIRREMKKEERFPETKTISKLPVDDFVKNPRGMWSSDVQTEEMQKGW